MEVLLAEDYSSHSGVDGAVGRVICQETLSLHI